jgi:hypothetical protein
MKVEDKSCLVNCLNIKGHNQIRHSLYRVKLFFVTICTLLVSEKADFYVDFKQYKFTSVENADEKAISDNLLISELFLIFTKITSYQFLNLRNILRLLMPIKSI